MTSLHSFISHVDRGDCRQRALWIGRRIFINGTYFLLTYSKTNSIIIFCKLYRENGRRCAKVITSHNKVELPVDWVWGVNKMAGGLKPT